MKEIYMLAGIGVGMFAGILLYKYCDNAKKIIDNTEKELMKKACKIEQSNEKQENKTENLTQKKSKKSK